MRVHYKWYDKIALLVVVWSKFLALSLPRNPSSQPVAIEDELLVRIIALHLFLRQAQERSRSHHILTVRDSYKWIWARYDVSLHWLAEGSWRLRTLLFLLTEKSSVGERKKETKRLTFHSLSLSHDLKKDGPIHLARKKDRARFLHIHHVKNSSISPHENPHWFHIKDANLYEDPILHDPILHHAEWWPACFWKEPANTAATLQIDS